jgi:exo-beta-1,3-glucanase (GH17 family)
MTRNYAAPRLVILAGLCLWLAACRGGSNPATNTANPQPTSGALSGTLPPSTEVPPTAAASPTRPNLAQSVAALENRLTAIRWIAYTPPTSNPDRAIEATPEAIRADLETLAAAGFTGLVTYQSEGVMGRELVEIAGELGYEGLIMGIWDPTNPEEIARAVEASRAEVVQGYCVGNEGLEKRYTFEDLSRAIEQVRQATAKPVTTSEEIDDYLDEYLLNLGDWVFPNAHPYFHSYTEAEAARRWTEAAYAVLTQRTDRFVMFKEVGLPTEGDPEADLSEAEQDEYYRELSRTAVAFVTFEAFDQPWKTILPVEPHWGIFYADRRPKQLAARLAGLPTVSAPTLEPYFYVYKDSDYPYNHFTPSGHMGDIGDILLDTGDMENAYEGKSAIRIEYAANGLEPNECRGARPCRWAGIYWQEPPNNWGEDEFWKDQGFNLTGYTRLTFWAKADQECESEFKVGGIAAPYGDSQAYPVGILAHLTTDWQQFTINLEYADLTHIIGGFEWDANWYMARQPVKIYLDEIRFEK